MTRWLQRFAVFLAIAGLIAGGLGWATAEALRMEENQRRVEAQKERAEKLRLTLWRLDAMIAPQLARENNRPFAHFSALNAPMPALSRQGVLFEPGSVRVASPLLDVELPPWMLLHFQYTPSNKGDDRFQSPQVLPAGIRELLQRPPASLTLANVTPEREEFLQQFRTRFAGDTLLAEVRKHASRSMPSETVVDEKGVSNSLNPAPNQSQANDGQPQSPNAYAQAPQYADTDKSLRQAATNTSKLAPRGGRGVDPGANLDSVTAPKSISAAVVGDVQLSSMEPFWFPSAGQPEYLVYARLAQFGKKEIAQGVIIRWPELRDELRQVVTDLFPEGRLVPVADGADPDEKMFALPVRLDPGPTPAPPAPAWTPLRVGLGVAWGAVLLALLAMCVSGWSLIDLSERRVRFVSAVTHELRTPLTTLRLYLDMLTGGLVTDASQKDEYLRTLNTESERLHRLISNVLDFARLERQSARPAPTDVALPELVGQLDATWRDRCEAAGKELVIDNGLPPTSTVHTDAVLVQQILGNLIDNACKYSKSAPDRRVWLRARPAGSRRVAFEVEDCGPGVGRREWRSVFRPFRRGDGADVTAGGVGLGLALARRWAAMLGGRLELCRGRHGGGACFRLELPA